MKKTFLNCIGILLSIFLISCTTNNDVKEITGTLIFNDIGSHSFNINAENIEATITIAGSNKGEHFVFENVELYRTADYTVKIDDSSSTSSPKTELLNNSVQMYEAKSGINFKENLPDIVDSGFVKIDWKGIY